MPRIIGLDLSLTSTGVCIVQSVQNRAPSIGYTWKAECRTVISKPGTLKTYSAMSERIGKIADQIIDLVSRPCVDLVVIEGPSFGSKGAHTHSRDWLWGHVYEDMRDIAGQVIVATPSQRMKYATGKGNAAKDAVLAAAIKRWPEVDIAGNDQADALILAAIGARHLGVPIDGVPVSHHQTVMAKLAA